MDYIEQAQALVTDKYQKPLFLALIGALSGALQEADDIAVSLPQELLDLDSAVGVQLVRLAQLVGAPILGEEDQIRALAKTWIRRNRSKGTLEDLIAVLQLFPVSDFDISELYPARIEVTAFEVPIALHEALAFVLSGTRAAGIGLGLGVTPNTRTKAFKYSGTGATVPGSPNGYSQGRYVFGFEA